MGQMAQKGSATKKERERKKRGKCLRRFLKQLPAGLGCRDMHDNDNDNDNDMLMCHTTTQWAVR